MDTVSQDFVLLRFFALNEQGMKIFLVSSLSSFYYTIWENSLRK